MARRANATQATATNGPNRSVERCLYGLSSMTELEVTLNELDGLQSYRYRLPRFGRSFDSVVSCPEKADNFVQRE
jgi:hypothetical protein